MVDYVIRRGDRLFAKVHGSEELPYDTAVFLRRRHLHRVLYLPLRLGRLLQAHSRRSPNPPARRRRHPRAPPLEQTLSAMSADELRSLALRMVERDPRMANVIDGLDHLDEEPDCDCEDHWWE